MSESMDYSAPLTQKKSDNLPKITDKDKLDFFIEFMKFEALG